MSSTSCSRLILVCTAWLGIAPLELSAQADAANCKTLDQRTALPIVHEYCAESAAHATGSAAKAHFDEAIKRTLKVKWSQVPAQDRNAMVSEVRSILDDESISPPAESADVEVVAPRTNVPAWLKTEQEREQVQMASTNPGLFGAVLRYCMVDGQDGHYETSRRAFGMDSGSTGAQAVALASLEPDDFRWDSPYAHGQANYDPETFEAERKKVALANYQAWLQDYLKNLNGACSSGDHAMAAYWTGYLLHAVQDLATHAGQTNPEHSYRAKKGQNPDAKPVRVALGLDWSAAIVERLRASNKACYDKILLQPTPTAGWLTETGMRLFKKRDGTLRAKREYLKLAGAFTKAGKKPGPLWFSPDDKKKATPWFEENVLSKLWPKSSS